MSVLGSSNPVLSDSAFDPRSAWSDLERDAARSQLMTVRGTAVATALLLGVVAIAAVATWLLASSLMVLMIAGLIGSLGSLVLTWTVCWKRAWSPALALPIALCEGALVGSASVFWSLYAEGRHAAHASGIVASLSPALLMQAGLLTICIAAGVLVLNATGLVRATGRFMAVLSVATAGVCLVSMISWISWLAGFNIPFIWDNGIIGIGFALVVVVLAAMTLVADFDFIRDGAENGLPKHMEWYAAIGVLVTLVWLYISLLRLLAKFSRRN